MLPAFIRNRIPLVLFALRDYYRIKSSKQSIFQKNRKPKAYIFLAADYGNLGDIAITIAQKELLKKFFSVNQIIEVPATCSLSQIKTYCKQIKHNDLITIVGGGNMGDMYSLYEIRRQLIVKLFPKNKIISFPQTTDYSYSEKGLAMLKSAIYTYKGNNLLLLAREKKSFDFMKQNFSARCKMTPDVVMTLKGFYGNATRKDLIYFCFRNDKEKSINSESVNEMMSLCHKYGQVKEIDTYIGDNACDFHKSFQDLLNQLSQAHLMVTDRLHGMIFAYITGTPCIAFDNSNGKIGLCYEWIKNSKYIYYLHSYNQQMFEKAVKAMMDIYVDNAIIESEQQEFINLFQEILQHEIQN